jgi:arginase family enzyme
MGEDNSGPIGPVDGRQVPRFAGSGSFARIPEIDRVGDYDVAVLGVPFDSGTSYRPGARFGPMADVLDPAFAPGTGTPEAGGLTSRELLRILRGLTAINLVGSDVVEVAPAYDHAEVTAFLANRVVLEALSGIAWRRRRADPAAGKSHAPQAPLLEGRDPE